MSYFNFNLGITLQRDLTLEKWMEISSSISSNYFLLFLKQYDPNSVVKFWVVGDMLVKKDINLIKLKKLIKAFMLDAIKEKLIEGLAKNNIHENTKGDVLREPKTNQRKCVSLLSESSHDELLKVQHKINYKSKIVLFNENLATNSSDVYLTSVKWQEDLDKVLVNGCIIVFWIWDEGRYEEIATSAKEEYNILKQAIFDDAYDDCSYLQEKVTNR